MARGQRRRRPRKRFPVVFLVRWPYTLIHARAPGVMRYPYLLLPQLIQVGVQFLSLIPRQPPEVVPTGFVFLRQQLG